MTRYPMIARQILVFAALVAALVLSASSAVAQQRLGNLSTNPYHSRSITNPYGAGSPYRSDEINNPLQSFWQPLLQFQRHEPLRHLRQTLLGRQHQQPSRGRIAVPV